MNPSPNRSWLWSSGVVISVLEMTRYSGEAVINEGSEPSRIDDIGLRELSDYHYPVSRIFISKISIPNGYSDIMQGLDTGRGLSFST